jgi:hypothetical protein
LSDSNARTRTIVGIRTVGTCVLAAMLIVSGCGGKKTATAPTATSSTATPPPETTPVTPPVPEPVVAVPPPPAPPVFLMGAGDIGECGRLGAQKTAELLDQYDGMVFTAGDNAYMNGTADEYRNCYNPFWGRHRTRTYPSPGNHEYGTSGPAGYFGYYGAVAAPAAPGYYSATLGAWHIIALNSNIPVDANSAQVAWLRSDLVANSTPCAIAFFHHPLFSSSENGGSARMRDIWRVLNSYGVDVVISGHDHVYERFAPQDADGRLDAVHGIRQFTVGTGGGKLYGFPRVEPNSEVRGAAWGIIRLALKATDYAWEFIPVAGESFRDVGTGTCH